MGAGKGAVQLFEDGGGKDNIAGESGLYNQEFIHGAQSYDYQPLEGFNKKNVMFQNFGTKFDNTYLLI